MAMIECVAEVLAPIAQGFLEMTEGRIMGGAIESVIGVIKSHFQSSEILPHAIHSSFEKGMDTLEVAIAGPRFYNKTAVKEFAQAFQKEILLPFLQTTSFREDEFVCACLGDIGILKKRDFFKIEQEAIPDLASKVGFYATQNAHEIDILNHDGRSSLSNVVRENTREPHALAALLRFNNVIAAAASMHFGLAIQKDERLFRAFFLINQKGVQRQLGLIHGELQKASDANERGLLELRQKTLQEIEMGMKRGFRHVSQEIVERLNSQFGQWETHFGVITDHLAELYDLGKTVLSEMTAHRAILHQILTEIQEIKRPSGPLEIVSDSEYGYKDKSYVLPEVSIHFPDVETGEEHVFHFHPKKRIVFGRNRPDKDPEVDAMIRIYPRNEQNDNLTLAISGHHFALAIRSGKLFFQDTSSRGSTVSGKTLQNGMEIPLNHGDTLSPFTNANKENYFWKVSFQKKEGNKIDVIKLTPNRQ